MRIGIVNLMTRTADVDASGSLFSSRGLAPPDESEVNVVELASRMVARGHEVHLFVAEPYRPSRRPPLPDGLEIHYVPIVMPFPFSPAIEPFPPSLGARIRSLGLDALQSGEVFQSGTFLGWLGNGHRVPFFIWQELDVRMAGMAGRIQGMFYATAGKRVASTCAAVVPRSESARQHLVDEGLGARLERTVHSGVDTGVFRPRAKEECRRHLSLHGKEDVLLFVGRLHPNKGTDVLLRAMPSLLTERKDAMLLVKGNGPDLMRLRALSKDLGIDGSVHFLTEHLSREAMASLYSAADALLVSSRTDLFPFAAIESISCGTPVLTSFGRGLRTDIVERGAGMMIPPDPASMAKHVLTVLSDKSQLKTMGTKGRELAVKEFDFEVSAARLLDVYGGRGGR